MSTRPSLTVSMLEMYYTTVKTMREYLLEILEHEDDTNTAPLAFLPNDTDTEAYTSLVDTSYVCFNSNDAQKRALRFKTYQPTMYMRQVIDMAQEQIFKLAKARGKRENVITYGYRLVKNSDGGKSDRTRTGITNRFVNTIVTALQAPEWESLLRRIGVDVMYHLLVNICIFVALPNESLCQMTGEPIVNILLPDRHLSAPRGETSPAKGACKKRPHPGSHESEPPAKRLRRCDSLLSRSNSSLATGVAASALSTTPRFTPADISLVRGRLFYSRPSRVPHANLLVVGLPPKHILNILKPAYLKKKEVSPVDYVDPDPKKQAEDTRHFSKYVFPRQYNLSSAFSPREKSRDAFKFPDFSDRQDEIKAKGACKTPKRLKSVLALLEQLIYRHGKCGYKPLRDEVCPSKILEEGEKKLDSGVILELMSEPSMLRSQASIEDVSVDSSGLPITPRGMSQAHDHCKHKPRFAEFACSHMEVFLFVRLVTKTVIPMTLWGCKRNFNHIMRYVKYFISCRRFETLSLHNILQRFSISECEWAMPTKGQFRVSVTDSLKRRELMEEFIYWYFDSFIMPLLKTTFYVTNSSAFKNQVLYFRQDDWQTLCAPLIDRLTSVTFEKIPQSEAEELLRQRKLGFSFVRLLPKDAGVRPIVNLGRRRKAKKGYISPSESSINQILQAAFQILTYEKKAQPARLGASVFGPNEVYVKLKTLKSQLPRDAHGNLPKLYFVKLDVQACFDTIEQSKLLEILRDLITQDSFVMQRYGQVTPVAGRIRRTFARRALPEDEPIHFVQQAAQLAEVLRHTIFVDQVVYPLLDKRETLQLLEEHITENIVKIGQGYYRQIVGIPQGSVLSTLLCSFFYGDLEKRFFKNAEDPQSVLLRLVDDYLFITTNLSKATYFLEMMMKGHPEYGCFISKDKTMTNFDFGIEIMNVTEPMQKHFPWCGYLINMEDVSVSVDYSRYHNINLNDSLTVDRGRRPGATFVHKMLKLAKLRSHVIYCDSDLNTEDTVYLNIYQNFVLTAMKMHGYLRTWRPDVRKSTKFIIATIRQLIAYTYAMIRHNASNKVAKTNAAKCSVQKEEVVWLGTHAFHVVLSQKSQRYASLMKSLAFELSLGRHRVTKRRFRKMVWESGLSMGQISF